jgi:hypothetical protein
MQQPDPHELTNRSFDVISIAKVLGIGAELTNQLRHGELKRVEEDDMEKQRCLEDPVVHTRRAVMYCHIYTVGVS